MGKDNRTPKKRAADCRRWYLKNREYAKMKARVNRQKLKSNPIAYATHLAKVRVHNRLKFGWKRVYKRKGGKPCLVTN